MLALAKRVDLSIRKSARFFIVLKFEYLNNLTSGSNKSSFSLYLTVFFSGVAGMALEFTGIRILQPKYGMSMNIWAINIAVIMAALALGYLIGGIYSQKKENIERAIYLALSNVGIYMGISYLIVVKGLYDESSQANAFITVFKLFFIPIFLLGAIYPLIIEKTKNEKEGKTAGFIFALSTLGNICGTLLPSFVLIPVLGVKKTYLMIAIVLEILALIGLKKIYKMIALLGIGLVIFVALYQDTTTTKVSINEDQSNSSNITIATEGVIYETESIYQKIRVIEHDGGYALSLANNNYISSYYHPNLYVTGKYYDYYSYLPILKTDKDLDVLIIGLGAGTISRQYQHFFGETHKLKIDGVEIDPEVIKVGKKYFELEQPSLTIYQMDGREFLNRTDKKYDIIIVDAYAKQSYIPFHLATSEFLQTIKEKLKPNGMVAYNVSGAFQVTDRLNYISNTMKSIFTYSYAFSPDNSFNSMLIGSKSQQIKWENSAEIPLELSTIRENFINSKPTLIEKYDPVYVIRDDKAPERI